MSPNTDSRPVPDPTVLTTQQLQREIAALKDLLEMRFEGMDKAVRLVQDESKQFPNRMDEKITAVASVNDVRFQTLDKRFEERDSRTAEHNASTKLAVDAALDAAKEAVSKSDAATVKQMDQLMLLIQSATHTSDDKIDDLKERLTRLEGSGEGGRMAKTTGQAMGNYVMAIIGTILAATGLLVAILLRK